MLEAAACPLSLPAGTICVSATSNEAAVKLSISDTGIGIPTEKFDQIFEAFQQVCGWFGRVGQVGGRRALEPSNTFEVPLPVVST